VTLTVDELRRLLDAFIEGGDRSIGMAGRIEVALDELFGEEEPFASASLALASYRPEGGPCLHDEDEMVRILRFARGSLPLRTP
jgi:hypothetical protein